MMSTLQTYLAERGLHSSALLQSYQRGYASDDDGLTAKYVSRVACMAMHRAGVKKSGHALRHTFAHRMIDAGASTRVVQLPWATPRS
jgi:site-specific recombinase XerD